CLLIRHQLPAAGILQEYLADGAVGFQTAEHIAASAMEKIRYRPQDFTLGPFTGAGRAEKQHCSIDHGASLCFNWISWISMKGIMTSSEAWPLCTSRCRSLAAIRVIRSPANFPREVLMKITMSRSASRRTTPKNPGNLVSKK